MAEIASAVLAFASASYGVATAIDTLIGDFNQAPRVIDNLRSHCITTRAVLKDLRHVVDDGLVGAADERRATLETYRKYHREFDAQLKSFLGELEKFRGSRDSRLRVVWRKQYFEDMRRDILERKGILHLLIASMQLCV
jgi:hypothetical protein